jgi:PAS domain-containing protein
MKRLPCALLEFDDDCVILDANARVCEVLGFDRAELLDGPPRHGCTRALPNFGTLRSRNEATRRKTTEQIKWGL